MKCEIEDNILSYETLVMFRVSRDTWRRTLFSLGRQKGKPDVRDIRSVLQFLYLAAMVEDDPNRVVNVDVQVVDQAELLPEGVQ